MPTIHIKAPRRGHFTCFHGEEAPPIADTDRMNYPVVVEPMMKCYLEAARRLPLAEMPYLLECLRDGGLCIGLLDPVSNIILNTINLLRRRRGVVRVKRMRKQCAATYDPSNKDTYGLVAYRSHDGLVSFMHSYFRYLTSKQAQRYLYLAGYDAGLAVLLVEHERHAQPAAAPHPALARTQAALMVAVRKAGHPEPDDLVQLMTSQFPVKHLLPILMELHTGRTLTVDGIENIINFLEQQLVLPPIAKIKFMCRPNSTTCSFSNGQLYFSGHIQDSLYVSGTIVEWDSNSNHGSSYIDVQRSFDLSTKLKSLRKAASTSQQMHSCIIRDLDATACQYISSLKMYLVDIVYSFYIKALACLPADVLRQSLIRGILVGGHCYGPLEPVSNIILNSIWYNMAFPLSQYPGSHQIEAADIINTGPLLRMVLHSIDGLVALIRASTMMLSEHEAVEYLCYKQCDLSEFLDSIAKTNRKPPFAIAAKDAKHPQHAAFGSFLLSLDHNKRFHLQCLLSTELVCPMLSVATLEHLNRFLFENVLHIAPSLKQQFPKLCKQAQKTIEAKKLDFLHKQNFVRAKLQDLLIEHADEHPWEPVHQLDVICGVEMGSYSNSLCYHVNFLASICSDDLDDDNVPVPKLFFAEIWEQSSNSLMRPSFCCPLPTFEPYLSRCSLCEAAVNKIVHPAIGNHSGGNNGESLDHFGCNDSEAFDLLHSQAEIWNRAPDIVESDFVFFDRTRDFKVATILNEMSSQASLYGRG